MLHREEIKMAAIVGRTTLMRTGISCRIAPFLSRLSKNSPSIRKYINNCIHRISHVTNSSRNESLNSTLKSEMFNVSVHNISQLNSKILIGFPVTVNVIFSDAPGNKISAFNPPRLISFMLEAMAVY